MENKNYLEQNIKKLIFSHGEEQKMNEEHKKEILGKLISNEAQAQNTVKSNFHIWRKVAIAASIVLIPVVLAAYLLVFSEHKIEIPPELASMSIEELLKLNNDSSQTTFDPNVIKNVLRQALHKAAPEEVIKIAKNLKNSNGMGQGMEISADIVPSQIHPIPHLGYVGKTFPEVVEETNLLVHATLLGVDIDIDDLIASLVEEEKYGSWEDFVTRYRATIHLSIVDCLPKNMLKKGREISITTIIGEDKLNSLKKNAGYYVCLTEDKNNKPHFLDYFTGIYPVDFNQSANIDFWQFFKDAQDILLFGQSPKTETIDFWISRLKNDDTYPLALEYMEVLPDEFIPAKTIMDFYESRYKDYRSLADKTFTEASNDPKNNHFLIQRAVDKVKSGLPSLEKIINLILRSQDNESIKRMLALMEDDLESKEKSVVKSDNKILPTVIRLIIAANEDDLGDKLVGTYYNYKDKLFIVEDDVDEYMASLQHKIKESSERGFALEIVNQALNLPLKDNQSFFLRILNNPSELGLNSADTFRKIWTVLGSSDDFDIRKYLEDFLSSPDLSDIGVELGPDSYSSIFDFEMAALDVLQSLPENKRPARKELLGYLLRIYQSNKEGTRNAINDKFKSLLRPEDTEVLPVIEDFLSLDYRRNYANNTALIITKIMNDRRLIPFIRAAIDKIPDNSDIVPFMEALYACGQEEEVISKALEILDMSLGQNVQSDIPQDRYRDISLILLLGKTQRKDLIPVIENYAKQDSLGNDIQQSALQSLARLAGKDSIPTLLGVYKNTNDIVTKVICSFGLYYNGDKIGEKLLRHLVEGTYMDVPDIQWRMGMDISVGQLFENIIKSYLRNELTDALWLEKLSHYLDRADTDIESEFFNDHRDGILNIMVKQLDNKDRTVRGYACEILQKATGQNFGFDNNRYAGQQEEIIQRWREYLNSHHD